LYTSADQLKESGIAFPYVASSLLTPPSLHDFTYTIAHSPVTPLRLIFESEELANGQPKGTSRKRVCHIRPEGCDERLVRRRLVSLLPPDLVHLNS